MIDAAGMTHRTLARILFTLFCFTASWMMPAAHASAQAGPWCGLYCESDRDCWETPCPFCTFDPQLPHRVCTAH